jgi:hypothetical protein
MHMAISAQELGVDDSQWQQLPDTEHLWYYVLSLDEENKTVDVLLKMAANKKVFLHRHTAPNHMLVLSGEHCLYKPDGTLKEVRPTGRYTASPADPEPHREGGGDEDTVILFSIRSGGGCCYEVLDDEQNVAATLGWEDFQGLWALQQQQAP